jgi:polyphosphate kinase
MPKAFHAAEQPDIFCSIRRQDILLHHPFDSFQPVLQLLQDGANDPDVLAIKITLYRVGPHSPIVTALLDARNNGKQVTVVVELKARFDEANNAAGARALEDAGAQVVYSSTDVKVHAKLCVVVRREGRRLRSYVHLSSGNYNSATARVYTDIGLLTCDEAIAADAADLFNVLTGYALPANFRRMLVAPINLREGIRNLILREIEWARAGVHAHLIFKMNALVDKETIRLLYTASNAGVQVDLIVRGICCLRPGIAGLSERIRVRSIVGRFLEHSRVFYFRNGGNEELYVGSADLMPRNLDRRVEVLFPIQEAPLRRRIRTEILGAYLADNTKARELQNDGSYTRVKRPRLEAPVSSQERLLEVTW